MQIKNLFYREKVITCIFILVAVIGGIFIYIFLSDFGDSEKIQGDFNEVLVASEYIAPGDFIKAENIEIQKISKSIFSDLFIEDIELVKNKIVVEEIEPGEIITYSKFEGFDSINRSNIIFSAYIPKGRKAVTVPVTYYGDPDMITIGDKVDIISTYYSRDDNNLIAETVLSEREIVFISKNGRVNLENQDESFRESQLDLLDFTNGNPAGSTTNKLMVTFYLSKEETENLFRSFESGELNISICSSKA